MKRTACFAAILSGALAPLCIGADNLVTNGSFELGDSGFDSDYAYSTSCGSAGIYSIVLQPHDCHSSWGVFGDHTPDEGAWMMAVNGTSQVGAKVWTTSVAVEPGREYIFSTWLASAYPTSPAQLQFSINGEAIGPVFTASTTVGLWQQFSAEWCADDTGLAVISIVNQNTAFGGNDFALDDIFFGTPIFADFDGNDHVDAADLAVVLGAWGPCPANGDGCCVGDLNEDASVDAADLALLLGAWTG